VRATCAGGQRDHRVAAQDRLATVTNNSDLFFEMSCALGFRLDCQDKSPRYSPRQPALVLLVGAGKGIQRRSEAVDLKVLELALLRTDLYWTIQAGWLCRLVETQAENVDLLVRISKRGIAAFAGSTIALIECACGSRGQRGCGHGKQDNHREPKLP
jgi:hypothetical protein